MRVTLGVLGFMTIFGSMFYGVFDITVYSSFISISLAFINPKWKISYIVVFLPVFIGVSILVFSIISEHQHSFDYPEELITKILFIIVFLFYFYLCYIRRETE